MNPTRTGVERPESTVWEPSSRDCLARRPLARMDRVFFRRAALRGVVAEDRLPSIGFARREVPAGGEE